MSSFSTMRTYPIVEIAKASKKHKNKKMKKEKKDKSKAKSAPNFQLQDGCCEMTFTQTQETKKRKKAKKKTKPDEDFQQPKIKKQPKEPDHTQDIQPIIYIAPDQDTEHSVKNKCHKGTKWIGKSKKRVNFNLPPKQNHSKTRDEEFGKKQLVEEPNTAEEMNSQDLFITQKSFLDPYVEISSSLSGNEAITTTKVLENHLCGLTVNATTQTENFFTFPVLSTAFRFQRQQNESKCEEEPMDLSLPNRTRQNHGPKHPTIDSANPPKLKISDTSAEDNDTASKAKGDLLQLKVIQTRLNESFFFRVKGEDSPKPMCPLMKLTGSKK